jgi:hypothetical protein
MSEEISTQHLSQDDFVLAYYAEPGIDAQREHLAACDACRAELERLAQVLDRVMPAEVPEPDEDYEARVWDRVAWRLRGERKHDGARNGMKWLAAAAMLAVAFLGGLLWNRSNTGPVRTANQPIATTTTHATATPTAASTQQQRDRILLVVVGDHLDDSERMLVELTNLTAKTDVDVSTERQRAGELLASNRLYRRTALDRGEDRVATLLDELEPVLMQIAHGPSQMTPDELQRVQKRVETKGLVFKLRVLRADVRATATPHLKQPNI